MLQRNAILAVTTSLSLAGVVAVLLLARVAADEPAGSAAGPSAALAVGPVSPAPAPVGSKPLRTMAVTFGGCSTGTASYDDAAAIGAPPFAAAPSSPEESAQLDALLLRDTDGLGAPGPNANPALVEQALAAVESEFPGTDRISDLYFDDQNVWMTIIDPQSPNRERSIYWSDGYGLSVGDPVFMEDDTTFPVSAVHPDAIVALVTGLAERYPTLQIDMPRLSTQLSYDLGLSWRMDLFDARGQLAIIFADLDGTVTVVDQEQE